MGRVSDDLKDLLKDNKDLHFYWNPEFEGTDKNSYKDS